MLFEDAVELLLIEGEARRLSPRTLKFYKDCLLKRSSLLCGREVATITVHDLRQVVGRASAASAHHVYRSVKRLFRFLEAEELIGSNPVKRLAAPRMMTKAVQPLTLDEVATLYATARRRGGYLGVRNSAIIATLVGTGLRRAELCRLTDADVRLRDGYLLVHGKGNKQRLVPLPANLRLILARYKVQRDRLKSAGRSEAFFRSRHGGPIAVEDLAQTVRGIGRDANVPVHVHKLRHTFASHFMNNDAADVLALQALGGWSSLQMVQRYAHTSLPKLQRSMERCSPVNLLRR